MDTVEKSIFHDATPSWNGYNYQGKVGLYVCLKNILIEAKKGIDTPSFDKFLSEYHIEYEWIEDFAIKKNDTYISLHQVKHKSENKFKDHTDAIATILYRKNGVLPEVDIFKYFTFKSRRKGDSEAIKKSIKHELTTHKLIDGAGKPDSNWKINAQNVDNRYRDGINKCFSDFELLVNNAFNSSITYFHTSEKVIPPSGDINKITGIPNQFVNRLTNPKSLSCQNIYLSFDEQDKYDLALSDTELNNKIEKQIIGILNILHKKEEFLEQDIILYKTALCALIDQHLTKRHQHIRNKLGNNSSYFSKTKPSILFKDIIHELKKIRRELNQEYWNLVCRERFEYAYNEQLEEIYDDIKNATDDCSIELYNQYLDRLEYLKINIIDYYFPNNCINFLRTISPHIDINEKPLDFHTFISDVENIKSIFLDFIQEVNKPIEKITLSLNKGPIKYQPSCINFNFSKPERMNKAIDKARKGLINNSYSESLINKNVDFIVVNFTKEEDLVSAGLKKITDVKGYDYTSSKIKESDKFTEEKEIMFIDSRKALGDINE